MKKTIFIKTFWSYIGISFLVLFLIFFFSKGTIKNFYYKNLRNHLTEVGNGIKWNTLSLFNNNDYSSLDSLVKKVGKETDIRITVIKMDGEVIGDSENDPKQMENHKDRPEIIAAYKGEKGQSIRFSSTMSENMLYMAMPVTKNSETQFVLRLSLYVRDIQTLIGELQWKFFTVLILLSILSLILSYLFSRGISNPIKKIVDATRKFSSGDFGVKVFLKNRDELKEVADSFNHMVEELKNLFTKLSENKEELQAVISSMKEGLMVIDCEGRIILTNESFQDMLHKSNITGIPYWEALRIPGFEESIQKAFKTQESFYQEVEMNNKAFLLGFNCTEQKGKLLVTFRDITDIKQLEKVKKDFVINLTHELKTPLTAIKGFVETLEEEENIQHKDYIEIIKRHTDRMNQIVSDLMVLSELEDRKEPLEFSKIDLNQILKNILKIFQDKIKKKKLKVKIQMDSHLPSLVAEQFRMEQMFVNLIDNAVKYTDKGEIVLSAKKEKNHFKIQIKDTGIGIPERNLQRIFERFYVVDKSRSRKMGGTGLGLSIVKHIVQLHNGKITVESEVEKGTTFTILFPV